MQHLQKKNCQISGRLLYSILFNTIYCFSILLDLKSIILLAYRKLEKAKIHITQLLKNICQSDDQKSFEEFYKLFYERLLNFCMHYIKHKESAEELVSDVFVQLWMKRKDLSHIQNMETYLFIAVKNRSLNHLRQFSKYRVIYLEDTGIYQLVNTHNPEKELEKKEFLFKMDEVVNSLPFQCKIIFNLIKEEGLKYKEVAEILNLSPRTVETQLVRAMKKLDKVISSYLGSCPKHPKTKVKILPVIRSILFSIIIFISCK